jgi:RNA polymerase sigma-70 factor (ECF subfamily)
MIQGCKEGDRKAQKAFYDYFASKMLGVCMRYAKDRSEAEDMLQESFIKLYQSMHTYRGEGNFEGWVRRVVVFNAINLYKHRLRHFKENLDVQDYDAKYDDDIISKISVKEILAFVQQMPDGYRLIFNLYAVERLDEKSFKQAL